mmetsp:Transcript_3840/g.12407  ORF Transcript_3840/g.12407 Transcript_3840/m.12407 type:complete len:266 (-) Transcript_3840:465-1262(-)
MSNESSTLLSSSLDILTELSPLPAAPLDKNGEMSVPGACTMRKESASNCTADRSVAGLSTSVVLAASPFSRSFGVTSTTEYDAPVSECFSLAAARRSAAVICGVTSCEKGSAPFASGTNNVTCCLRFIASALSSATRGLRSSAVPLSDGTIPSMAAWTSLGVAVFFRSNLPKSAAALRADFDKVPSAGLLSTPDKNSAVHLNLTTTTVMLSDDSFFSASSTNFCAASIAVAALRATSTAFWSLMTSHSPSDARTRQSSSGVSSSS